MTSQSRTWARTADPTYAAFMRETHPQDDDAPQETMPHRVYFALDREAAQIKIGYSTNIPRRIAQLGARRGRDLDLLGTMRGGYDLERAMHGRFAPYRCEAQEWYRSEIIGELAPLLEAER